MLTQSTATPAESRPATLLPPPLIYFAGLLGGWALNQIASLMINFGQIGSVMGWGLITFGLFGMAWALREIRVYRTTVNPYKAASALVTTGPFRFSRNPIYVSDWLVYAGVTFLLQTWWPWILAPVVWVLVRYGVIRHEEAHLRAKFGADYSTYCKTTRRWL